MAFISTKDVRCIINNEISIPYILKHCEIKEYTTMSLALIF